MIAALRQKRRGAAAVLRGIALAVVLAFAIGFGIGIWIRCAMERPEGYLAGPTSTPEVGGSGARAAAPLPLHVGLPGAVVRDTREHKE